VVVAISRCIAWEEVSCGGWGTEVGDSSEPRLQGGIDVSDRNVFVVYPFNHEVQELTTGGTFRIRWGSEGSKEGQLQNPSDIAIDGSTVYVADTGNHRVQALSFGGTFFLGWGIEGNGAGEFDTLHSVRYAPPRVSD